MEHVDKIQIFNDIDRQNRGYISKYDLEQHLYKQNFEDQEIAEFLNRFHLHEENLTYADYTNVLEVPYTQCPMPHVVIDSEFETINSKFEDSDRESVVRRIVRDAMDEHSEKRDVATNIKRTLDNTLDSLWHVVIVKGQYWAYYSHEQANSIVLKYRGHMFIIFKTPSN